MLFDDNTGTVGSLSRSLDAADQKDVNSTRITEDARIKVLIIAPTLDVFLGGQAIQAFRLMTGINADTDIHMDIQSIAPQFLPRLQRIKYLRTVLRGIKFIYDILTKIPRYDVIHVCSAAHISFLLAPTPSVIVSRIFGKKVILNYRSGQLRRHFRNWKPILSPTLKMFHRIVTPSHYLVDLFREYGFEAEAIYNFVDTDLFKFNPKRELRPIFLSNRLLEELYNIPCILRAFGLIQEKYPEARLVVASFGDQRDYLEKYAAELGLHNVEFVGKVSQEEMARLYDETDIYLNSPNTDNMPGSILECYSAGVPVVTTSAGGIPYILEHEKTGLMVKIGDHEALAAAAMRLLEEPGLAERLVRNGRIMVEKYTWENVRDRWVKLYDGLVEEGEPEGTEIHTDKT